MGRKAMIIMDFSASETKVNLMRAFAGESQARNRYGISAKKARDDGFYAIAKIFEITAGQEQAHATVFYNYLKEVVGTNFDIKASYPIDIFNTTAEYVRAASKNESEEYKNIYQSFGNTAKQEGFIQIAQSFYSIAEIEKTHWQHFYEIEKLFKSDTLYKRESETIWVCTNCGHIHTGIQAPVICPVCHKTQGYFWDKKLALL